MSETPEFNERNELHKDLEALEEDLKDLNEELTDLVCYEDLFVCLFEAGLEELSKDPAKLVQHRNFLRRMIEGDPTDLREIDEELNNLDDHEDSIEFVAQGVTLMIMKQDLDRRLQTKKQQILDKEEEIQDKKEEIEEEESMTEEQKRERGIKSYR